MKSLYYKIRGFAVTWLLRLLPRNQGVVFAGAGSAQTLCAQALLLGHRRILVVTDAFLAGSGLLDSTLGQLEEGGADIAVFAHEERVAEEHEQQQREREGEDHAAGVTAQLDPLLAGDGDQTAELHRPFPRRRRSTSR